MFRQFQSIFHVKKKCTNFFLFHKQINEKYILNCQCLRVFCCIFNLYLFDYAFKSQNLVRLILFGIKNVLPIYLHLKLIYSSNSFQLTECLSKLFCSIFSWHLSVRPSVNYYVFDFSFRTVTPIFNQTWQKAAGDSSLLKLRQRSLSRGDEFLKIV